MKSKSSTSSTDKVENINPYENTEQKLSISVQRLLKIESLWLNFDKSLNKNELAEPKKNTTLNILVSPLEKRFKFHFFTNRKTNNLDKVIINKNSTY